MERTRIQKIFIQNSAKPIWLEVSDNETYFGDTVIRIYDDYKVSLVLTDECGAVIGDKAIFPKRGDIMIFRPDEVHFGRFPKSSQYQFVSFFLAPDFFQHYFPGNETILAPFLDHSPERINWLRLTGEERLQSIALAEDIIVQMQKTTEKNYSNLLIFTRLMEALHLICQCYPQQKNQPEQSSLLPLITNALQKIDADFPEFVGLEELADHCGCSVTYLTQMFRCYTGKSIYQYLIQRRLECARRLLMDGESVSEACLKSGFSDCSRFIAQFQKHFGKTPGKYRKENRGAVTEQEIRCPKTKDVL